MFTWIGQSLGIPTLVKEEVPGREPLAGVDMLDAGKRAREVQRRRIKRNASLI